MNLSSSEPSQDSETGAPKRGADAMHYLDFTMRSPAENLACDEALLDWREERGGSGILRFWESPEPFVVVGYGNAIDTEVDRAACKAGNVPILRRCSGGGTVVQGPGCLNYALILEATENGPLRSIPAANRFVMEQNRAALETLLQRPVTVRGHTDLAIDEVKFSGNAQRRKKHWLLFHGSFLLHFDLQLIGALLPMPSREPDYRQSRSHDRFLTNLGVSADSIKKSLRQAWRADEPLKSFPCEAVATLVREKYGADEWNFKF